MDRSRSKRVVGRKASSFITTSLVHPACFALVALYRHTDVPTRNRSHQRVYLRGKLIQCAVAGAERENPGELHAG